MQEQPRPLQLPLLRKEIYCEWNPSLGCFDVSKASPYFHTICLFMSAGQEPPGKGLAAPKRHLLCGQACLVTGQTFPVLQLHFLVIPATDPSCTVHVIHGLLSGSSHPWHPSSAPVMEILIKISPTVSSSTCACRDGTSLLQGFGTSASCSTTVPCLQPAEIWDSSFSWGIPCGAY